MSTTAIDRSPTRYVWLQLAALGVGFAGLFLAHAIAHRLNDSDASTTFTTVALLAVVASALAVVGRAVYVIVTSAFSDAHRVFRTRHLMACSSLLFLVAIGAAVAVFAREPFVELFAHGMITGEDIADVATFGATAVCLVGSGVALSGAWERRHVERNWYRALHRSSPSV